MMKLYHGSNVVIDKIDFNISLEQNKQYVTYRKSNYERRYPISN